MTNKKQILLATMIASWGMASQRAGAVSGDDVSVSLCDGQSVMTVPGLKRGEVLSVSRAKAVVSDMMRAWRRSQPEGRWRSWASEMPSERAVGAATQAAPAQPTKFTPLDLQLWQREEKKFIDEGYKNFHSAKALGGTIGISCDMCHPDASNTHPETYPKFQSQIRKVALLRDMINWCIENPMKGKPLAENDPVLRSVEVSVFRLLRNCRQSLQ